MLENGHLLARAFNAAMQRLGPFEPHLTIAVAVSGGADSMALAILTRDWAFAHGGSSLALVVDHGLRPASCEEARITVQRLTQLGVPARVLPLLNLAHGASMAERARIRRYQALSEACRDLGVLHLLLGHHIADQAETLAMRVLQGSQNHGLAAMSALTETTDVRLLRPLLEIEPASLRQFLGARGVGWVEDPSNHDLRATRSRLRHCMARVRPSEVDPTSDVHRSLIQRDLAPDSFNPKQLGANGWHAETRLTQSLALAGRLRAHEEAQAAAELARRATIRPEGFALVSPGRISVTALRGLLRTIGGRAYAPSLAQIGHLAAQPRPATVAGVRIMPAGRLGSGLLLVREEQAIMEPVEARPDSIWDNRFRLIVDKELPTIATIGKLGADAAHFRRVSDLPSAVLRTLPAIRFGKVLKVVPHLGYSSNESDFRTTILFISSKAVAGPDFVAAS